jgi:hypothetical protein
MIEFVAKYPVSNIACDSYGKKGGGGGDDGGSSGGISITGRLVGLGQWDIGHPVQFGRTTPAISKENGEITHTHTRARARARTRTRTRTE